MAEAGDAGQAFTFTGFYPNLQGGKVPASRSTSEGLREPRKRAACSGSIISACSAIPPSLAEVYSSAGHPGPAIDGTPQGSGACSGKCSTSNGMKVPFSSDTGSSCRRLLRPRTGAGRFHRGTVDYTAQRINLGGTYVPLQGINSALCNIPLVGPIVSGLDCQGVFGITYAIQGRCKTHRSS